MTGELDWKDTHSLERMGRGDDEVLLPPMSVLSESAWSSVCMKM